MGLGEKTAHRYNTHCWNILELLWDLLEYTRVTLEFTAIYCYARIYCVSR